MPQISPLTKLFGLSLILALGFLNIVLSCALYNTYYPLWVIFIFLIAPIPNSMTSCIMNSSNYGYDYNYSGGFESNDPISTFDGTMKFFTGMLVSSGSFLPLVLWNCNLIVTGSALLSLSGGALVYLSFLLFGLGFKSDHDDNYDF